MDGMGPSSLDPLIAAFMSGWGVGQGNPIFAERLGAVNRCLQLTAQQIASMPLVQSGKAPEPAWLQNPEPDLYTGVSDAIFVATWSRYARGETFFYCTSRYSNGYPATFVVLDPVTMQVQRDDYGIPQYESNSYPLKREDVLHIKRDHRPGQLRGTPALEAYWSNIASAWASETFAADNMNRGGVPATVLKWSQGKLTAKQAEALQNQWVAAVQNRMGAPAVLDQNLDYSVLAFSPKDLMLLELREFDTKQIASAFGVPAFLLNLPQAGGLNYTNPVQLFDIWWRSELLTTAHSIAVGLSNWLPANNWLSFDPSIVLRPDFSTMVASYLQLLAQNVVTADEVRAHVLNLPPLSEGEDLGLINQPAITEAAATQPPSLAAVRA
jgi:HK97 family phage portal protein